MHGAAERRHRPSPAQVPLWFLHRLQPRDTSYNLAFREHFAGRLDVEAFRRGLEAIIHRHDALRTRFETTAAGPIAVVTAPARLEMAVEDLRGRGEPARRERVDEVVAEVAATHFDLSRGPLYRFELLALSDDEHVCAFAFHHTVFDGWSIDILVQELGPLYAAALDDAQAGASALAERAGLPAMALTHADWAEAQHAVLEGDALQAGLDAWTGALRGAPPALPWPGVGRAERDEAGPRPAGTVIVHLTPQDRGALDEVARTHGVTPFMVLLAALDVLLLHYTGQHDLVVGTPAVRRMRKATRGMIGMLLDTLALRVDVAGNPTFAQLLERTKATCLAGFRNQAVPFDRIVQALSPTRTPGQNPIFEVMMILQAASKPLQMPGIVATYEDAPPRHAKLDLTVSIADDEQGLHATFEHAADRIDGATVGRMAAHWVRLVRLLLADPAQPIEQVALLDEQDRRAAIVAGDDDPSATAPPVCELVALQAARTPQASAVQDAAGNLTYAQLQARANRVAHHLQGLGVAPGDHVAVALPRSADWVPTLLGVMRAQAAYVPVDPTLPHARVAQMLEDAGPRALVTTATLADSLPTGDAKVLRLDADAAALEAQPATTPTGGPTPDAIAYTIFTSGSTGRPKGVSVTHANLTNLVRAIAARPGVHEGDRLLAVTTPSFDIAALELLVPPSVGATVVVAAADAVVDGARLAEMIADESISLMQATPTTWRLLVDSGWAGAPQLRILCGGEPLPVELARALLPRCAALHNVYGPTETTIWSTIARLDEAALQGDVVPLGEPLPNTTLAIVGPGGTLAPPGVAGELWIGGRGVAAGYLERPELTAARFVEGPDGGRTYRTGDRVRRRADGRLEFHGRLDHQLKIRGFRVEPGEIEARLRTHPSVGEAVVVSRPGPGGELRLVGYVTPEVNATLDPAALREHVRETLPPYMVPSSVVPLSAMPRLPSGKLDRASLPAPGLGATTTNTPDAPPRDDLELQLTKTWEGLLGVVVTSVHESFFDLGGHSLLAVRLAAQLERTYGRALPVHALFAAQTVAAQAELLRGEGLEVPWRALDAIKPSGRKPPFFFVGSTVYARAVAALIDPEQPVYGLLVFGLLPPDGRRFSMSVEEVAAAYVEEIRTVQPRGPYFLGGYCQEARVALEMALQLRAAGEEVALLAYIDVFWLDVSRGQVLWNYARNVLGKGLSHLTLHARNFVERQGRDLYRRGTQLGYRWYRATGKEPVPVHYRDIQLIEAHEASLSRYEPRAWPGDMTILMSGEYFTEDAAAMLAHLAQGQVRVHSVPGAHIQMFEPPQVGVLTGQLERAIALATCDPAREPSG